MPEAIRETIVTPDESGHDVVLLRISDVPLNVERASLQITILARLPQLKAPTVQHLQRQAMKAASDVMTPIFQELAREIAQAGYDLEMPLKNSRR